eukprot:scaffold29302_cov43-Cyclotella_meneghiniana.AAC.1
MVISACGGPIDPIFGSITIRNRQAMGGAINNYLNLHPDKHISACGGPFHPIFESITIRNRQAMGGATYTITQTSISPLVKDQAGELVLYVTLGGGNNPNPVHPSVNTGYSIPALLNNLTSWGTRSCSNGYEEVCPNCNDFARLVDYRDRFLPMDVNEERVLVCKVRSFNEKELSSLKSIDREFDFTKYVNDDSGCKYLATLTGYIYEPESKRGHFQCMVKGRYYDTEYWEVDDMGDMPGIPPVDMWEQPYLMFYTIVNLGRADQLDVPFDGNLASESRKDITEAEFIELSSDEEDAEGKELWKFESPIGRVGYTIYKYFHTGWFKGKVVYIRDINGNSKNKADSDDDVIGISYPRDGDMEEMTFADIKKQVHRVDNNSAIRKKIRNEYILPFMPQMTQSLIEEADYYRGDKQNPVLCNYFQSKNYPTKIYSRNDDWNLDFNKELKYKTPTAARPISRTGIQSDNNSADTFYRLRPGKFVNDEAVNRFSLLFNAEERKKLARDPDNYIPSIMLQSWFTASLKGSNRSSRDDKWT